MHLPSYPARFAHLAALWAYGVSQPVFSMLDGNPEFLVVRGSTRTDVVVFALLITVVPPLLVVAAEALASLVSRALEAALHTAGISFFVYVVGLEVIGVTGPARRAALLAPLVLAVLGTLLYLRSRAVRTFLSFSLALPVLGALSFVGTVPLAVDDARGENVAVGSPVPIVLVVFDELPLSSLLRADGSIDRIRYPGFGRLARDATWYPRATTVHESTTHAVPAVLTGMLPDRGELPRLTDHPDNLFTLLGERYGIRASEQVTRLCPSRNCPRTRDHVPAIDRQKGLAYDVAVGYLHRVLPASFRGELPAIGERWGGFGDTARPDVRERVLVALDDGAWLRAAAGANGQERVQFASFLRSLRPRGTRPTLFFEHALLPHGVWRFLPSGREYSNAAWVAGVEEDWNRLRPQRALVEIALQRHLLQVGFTDQLLGALLRRLEELDLYDQALVIVTADHGASFRPGGSLRTVDRRNLADIAAVPLIVKYPGQTRERTDTRDAKTIDIVPTIADVIGVHIPWRVDGRSLRGSPSSRPVSVATNSGEVVGGTSNAVAEAVRSMARRNAALFGEGNASMYRLGPHPQLHGRPVAAQPASRSGRPAVRLEDVEEFTNVRKRSFIVPARIVGEITDQSIGPGTALAIVVNGRVVATTTSYTLPGRTGFAVMVPETAYHEGRNAVDVFEIRARVDGLRLTWLGGTPRTASAQPASTSVASTSAWRRPDTHLVGRSPRSVAR
jgi:Sulfatase